MRRGASAFSCLAAAVLLLSVPIAAAFAADPFSRATIDAQGTIYPGQQIAVQVDVLVPNFFMSPPQFPLFDLPNAVLTLPDSGAQNLNEPSAAKASPAFAAATSSPRRRRATTSCRRPRSPSPMPPCPARPRPAR